MAKKRKNKPKPKSKLSVGDFVIVQGLENPRVPSKPVFGKIVGVSRRYAVLMLPKSFKLGEIVSKNLSALTRVNPANVIIAQLEELGLNPVREILSM